MTTKLENFIDTMNKMGEQRIPFLFIIDYEMNMPVILPLDETAKAGVFFSVRKLRNFKKSVSERNSLHFTKNPVDFSTYLEAFETVMKQIRLGNTFLLNLTFPTGIETNRSLRNIFEESDAPYRLLYRDGFVLFSPECFVRILEGVITSYPMKGTIDASIPGAAGIIGSDKKENAEHATIVDLIRNDLSMVANQVEVKKYRYLEEVVAHDKTLLQVSSEISGILPEDYRSNLGTIICRLLPAGSISGAPKPSTLKIIRKVESYQRGYYTGVFGVFDGTSLDSAVMIRYIERLDGKLIYKSGGGITMNSEAHKEYQELIDKVYVPIH